MTAKCQPVYELWTVYCLLLLNNLICNLNDYYIDEVNISILSVIVSPLYTLVVNLKGFPVQLTMYFNLLYKLIDKPRTLPYKVLLLQWL